MTRILLICLVLGICVISGFSQDSSLSLTTKKLKTGIYKEWEEFIHNTPSVTSPFYVVPNYRKNEEGEDSSVNNNGSDTLILNYHYEFLDSNIKQKRAVGFFDGTRMFVPVLFPEQFLSTFKTPPFRPVDYIGRFPFIAIVRKPIYLVSDPISLVIGLVDAVVSHPKEEIWYFNKKGKFILATPQAIAFLIQNDKDLAKEFSAEKEKTNAVFKKYLIKMNERYPL